MAKSDKRNRSAGGGAPKKPKGQKLAATTAEIDQISFDVRLIAGSVKVHATGTDGKQYDGDFAEDEAENFIKKVFGKVSAAFYGETIKLNVNNTDILPIQ
jgi:hypothetical protein